MEFRVELNEEFLVEKSAAYTVQNGVVVGEDDVLHAGEVLMIGDAAGFNDLDSPGRPGRDVGEALVMVPGLLEGDVVVILVHGLAR